MIRRLHMEPPKLALPSDKSQKSEDPTTKDSIAAEFKKLLERARSGLSGARDEVVALGMALSQAVSTVKTHSEEISQSHPGHDEIASENVMSDDDSQQLSGEMSDDPTCGVEQVTKTHTKNRGPEVNPEVDGDTEAPELQEGESVILEEDGGEVLVDDEVEFIDLDNLDVETQVITEQNDLGLEVAAQQAQLSMVVQQDSSSEEVVEENEVDVTASRVVVGEQVEEEQEEFVDEQALLDDVGNRGLAPEMLRSNGHGKSSLIRALDIQRSQDEFSDRVSVPSQAEFQDLDGVDEEEFSRPAIGFGEMRTGNDIQQTLATNRRENASSLSPAAFETFTPAREQNSELSIQLTLLRQAFESLKAQTQGQGEVKPRLSTSAMGSVSASSETKANQSDAAPKALKYLNRATAARMMERIESALKEAARSRDGKTISLKLEPVHLGQVKCDVSLRDGLLHARITPQNREVLQVIREHSHDLQGALRRLGLNVDRVTVQVVGEKEVTVSPNAFGFLDGKSFQEERNNMPARKGQTPENTFGNEFADVPKGASSDAGKVTPDHWIA